MTWSPMIARIIRYIELDIVRDLAKHPRLALWIARHATSGRRTVQVFLVGGMFLLVCMVPYRCFTYAGTGGVPLPPPEPQVIVRMILTNFGVLTPVAFYVLLHMRFSRWRWPVTGLVALFAYPWFSVEVVAIWSWLGTFKVVMNKLGPGVLLVAVSAMGLLVLFGSSQRIFDLAESERARQQAQHEQ